jgi:hypothetical protein
MGIIFENRQGRAAGNDHDLVACKAQRTDKRGGENQIPKMILPEDDNFHFSKNLGFFEPS